MAWNYADRRHAWWPNNAEPVYLPPPPQQPVIIRMRPTIIRSEIMETKSDETKSDEQDANTGKLTQDAVAETVNAPQPAITDASINEDDTFPFPPKAKKTEGMATNAEPRVAPGAEPKPEPKPRVNVYYNPFSISEQERAGKRANELYALGYQLQAMVGISDKDGNPMIVEAYVLKHKRLDAIEATDQIFREAGKGEMIDQLDKIVISAAAQGATRVAQQYRRSGTDG